MTSLQITAIITTIVSGLVVFGCWGFVLYNEFIKK